MQKIWLLILMMLWASSVIAQEDCAEMIEHLPLVAEACAETDSLCLVAVDSDGGSTIDFLSLNELIASNDFEAIETVYNEEEQSFIVLRLPLHENKLSIVIFGNTRLENTVALSTIKVTAIRGVNLRQMPSVTAQVIASLRQGETYTAIGRLEDNTWVQIQLEGGQIGWVSAQFLKSDISFAELSAISPNAPTYLPMQAFDLQADDICSGLLLITPDDDMIYEVAINKLHIQINGAAIVNQAEDMLTVATLTGESHVIAFGFEQIAKENEFISTPLSESGILAGIPSEAQTYTGYVLLYELFLQEDKD